MLTRGRAGLVAGGGRQGRSGRVRASLRGDPGETLRRRGAYLAQARSCRRGHAGDLSEGLEQRRAVRPRALSSDPITWMVAIARNRAIDLVRKKTEMSIEEQPHVLEVAADTPDPLARREMTEELRRLLACMGRLETEERRRLVLLAYYDGWSRERRGGQIRRSR